MRKGFTTKDHLLEITDWVHSARTGKNGKWDVTAVVRYSKKWILWYTNVQPEWCSRLNVWPLPHNDQSKEGMEAIDLPGPNGLLMLVGSLYLWRKALGKKPLTEVYGDVFSDVDWVFTQLIQSHTLKP